MLASRASLAPARLLLAAAALLLSTTSLQVTAAASYQIQDTYDATNFFDEFEFFSAPDPTEGFVRYQTALEANASALAGYANGGVFLGVDAKTPGVASPGRASTRVNTRKKYTRGLFVADIAHMPSSTCGVWAAFWSFGDPWPSAGEIDIIEGVNRDTSTKFTLHTASGCSFANSGAGNCNAPGDGTKGCTQPGFDNALSYGDGFNSIGGGVFATEWTSEAIRIWFFPRNAPVPGDLNSPSPDPSTWGPPAAQFLGSPGQDGCDIDSHFREHRLVFNTALCGQWAGKVFGQDAQCAGLASSCEAYVANHPEAFASAYWLINSVKVYSR
ncbi:family 16 glycoside hydrolase, partial [Microdochium bolleyi]